MSEPAKWTASDLKRMLREKYPHPGFATFAEVGNGTGARAYRHADTVVCSLFPSAGLWIAGFEIKVSRGDWLNELKQPEKADAIARHCNYWWIVAPDMKIVNPEEAPPHWGVMTVHGGALRVKRQAKHAERGDDTKIDRAFAAALFRAAEKSARDPARIAETIAETREEERRKWEYKATSIRQDLDALRKNVYEFEQASGLKIERSYASIPKVGAIVKRLLDQEHTYRTQSIRGTIHEFRAALKNLESCAGALEEAEALIARESGLVPVPDALYSAPASPAEA